MKEEYIKRHRDPERRKQAHPVLAEILAETYGVMVYQEDVLKIAHFFAGLSLEEADILRRGMSGKKRNEVDFRQLEDKFRNNCREKGYSEELIRRGLDPDHVFCRLRFSEGTFGFLCGGKLPESLPEILFSAGIHGCLSQ